MKKIISILLLLTLCLSMLIACDGGDNNKDSKGTQLAAPVLKRGDKEVTWEKVENATKYEILVNANDPVFVDANTTSYPMGDNQAIKIRAVGDGDKYLTSNWSNSIYSALDLEVDEWD